MRASKYFLAAASLLLIGVGCGPVLPEAEKLPTEPAAALPYYIAYTEQGYRGALDQKRPILLYFWAVWCPICRAEEPSIRASVESLDVPAAGFRVDFDTETSLKRRFKVPYQHTTIILNPRGDEVARYSGPVPAEELRAALRNAAK